jgi:hypothetical protein
VLGIVDAPDAAYANAARRRFADPSEIRARALALIDELDRETRATRHEPRRNARPRFWRRSVLTDPASPRPRRGSLEASR